MKQSLWFEFLSFAFFWAGAAMLALGLLILVAPGPMLRAGAALNRWFSTDSALRGLDATYTTERTFYRHHRLFGALLVAASLFVIYTFAFALDVAVVARKLTLFGSRTATDWIFQSLAVINVIFGAAALLLGIAVFVRPSVLKQLEAATNRWFAVDESFRRLDAQLSGPDTFFARHPRLLGALVSIGGAYIVASLKLFLK